MSVFNEIKLTGRLAKDVEIRDAGKTQVAKVTLAVPYYDNREKKELADFINVELWGKDATALAKHCGKGNRISVIGELKNTSYDKPDGSKGYRTFVRVSPMGNNLMIIDFKNSQNSTNSPDDFSNSEGFSPVDNGDLNPVDDGDIPF